MSYSGDFEVSLLILSSLVIKADGKQDQRELDFVRRQFVQMYGKDRANHAIPFCDLGGIQTPNLLSRNQMLYSVKLRSH